MTAAGSGPSSLGRRCAIYVWTRRADASWILQQVNGLLAHLARVREGQVVAVYVDEGSSVDERPSLALLLASVRRNELDLVAVTEISRLARDRGTLAHIVAAFSAAGVELVVSGGMTAGPW